MIIFGTKAKHRKIGEGDFYCPQCQAKRHYIRKASKRYFSLYFVPVIPMDDIGEFVECETCHTIFTTDVLKLRPTPHRGSLPDLLNSVKALLNEGMPVEYLVRDLNSAGLERDVALTTVNAQIGEARNVCHTCNLTYAASVDTCIECKQALEIHDH